jgi:hypothetical protein
MTSALRLPAHRIVMSDAEAGLTPCWWTGALVAILPEVEAMVGFGDGARVSHKDLEAHEAGRASGGPED